MYADLGTSMTAELLAHPEEMELAAYPEALIWPFRAGAVVGMPEFLAEWGQAVMDLTDSHPIGVNVSAPEAVVATQRVGARVRMIDLQYTALLVPAARLVLQSMLNQASRENFYNPLAVTIRIVVGVLLLLAADRWLARPALTRLRDTIAGVYQMLAQLPDTILSRLAPAQRIVHLADAEWPIGPAVRDTWQDCLAAVQASVRFPVCCCCKRYRGKHARPATRVESFAAHSFNVPSRGDVRHHAHW